MLTVFSQFLGVKSSSSLRVRSCDVDPLEKLCWALVTLKYLTNVNWKMFSSWMKDPPWINRHKQTIADSTQSGSSVKNEKTAFFHWDRHFTHSEPWTVEGISKKPIRWPCFSGWQCPILQSVGKIKDWFVLPSLSRTQPNIARIQFLHRLTEIQNKELTSPCLPSDH